MNDRTEIKEVKWLLNDYAQLVQNLPAAIEKVLQNPHANTGYADLQDLKEIKELIEDLHADLKGCAKIMESCESFADDDFHDWDCPDYGDPFFHSPLLKPYKPKEF